MAYEARVRAARSGIALTPLPDGSLIKSRPASAAPPRLRAQLLGGAARIALPAASMIVALGVGLPTEAQAQSSGFNGTQATTYTLTTGANTPTFTFGPAAVIGPTAPGTPGVTGDNLTSWNVINQGQINGGGAGGYGIYLHNPGGGDSVTNSGSITNGVRVSGNLANLAGGTITGFAKVSSGTMTNAGTITGIARVGSGTMTNAGIITGNAFGGTNLTLTNSGNIGGNVSIAGTGTVTNQAGGTITGGVVLSTFVNADPGALTNAGAIGSSAASSNNAVTFNGVGTLTNQSGGTLTGVTDGVILVVGGNVTNQVGATIAGGTHGIYAEFGPTTVTNAGAIAGTAGNGIYLLAGGSITNQAGGTITGGVAGVYVQSSAGSSSVANQAGGAIVGGVNGVKIANGGLGVGTVTNAGSITGTSGTGVSVVANQVSVTNLAGGTITGATGISVSANRNATVTNAGTITGTGGTAINILGNSPTLILQTGSVINGDAVASSANGRLILQGTGTANNLFTGFFSGFDVQASGLWALNNVNTFAGTTIESGALVIGDASHPGAQLNTFGLTVQPGGTLGGQGTVTMTGGGVNPIFVANGGTIAPGIASPFSTLNVTGNVQFNTGSFFNVNVNGAGQTDKLALSGTATLTGGTVQVQPAAGNYAGSTNYTILTAGTRNSTTFAGVTMNNIFLTPTLTYPSAQEVDLTLTSKAFNTAASTPNQTAVANALNAGAQNALTAILFGQTSIAGA